MAVPTFELTHARARAVIAPDRGALVARWSIDGEELLYLDETTFEDRDKNVRGGNPVLFPSPGKLRDDRWARGTLKQHGFGRQLPWAVTSRTADRTTLTLEDNETTRANYPFSFRADLHFVLGARTLRVEQEVQNRGTDRMPFGFGFHPYFIVPVDEKPAATIDTSATRAFDNVTKETIDLHGIALGSGEVDLHLLDHNCNESELAWFAGTRRMHVRASRDYRRWVVWTLPDKPFVCLEPWTSAGDALNTGELLLELGPTETWRGFVEYELE